MWMGVEEQSPSIRMYTIEYVHIYSMLTRETDEVTKLIYLHILSQLINICTTMINRPQMATA